MEDFTVSNDLNLDEEYVNEDIDGEYEEEEELPEIEIEEGEEDVTDEDDGISFAQALEQEFGWEGIPENIDPITAIAKIKQGYEAMIEELRENNEGNNSNFVSDEREEVNSAYKEFLGMDKEDAILDDLIYNGYSEDEARLELEELKDEGKLDKEYRRLKVSMKKEYEETLGVIEQSEREAVRIKREQEQIYLHQQQLMIDNSISNLESPLFSVTSKDKEFVKNLYKTGKIEQIKNDPKMLSEMILSYVKVQEIKNGEVRVKKQATQEVIRKLSKEPIVNTKIGKEKTKTIFNTK